jgi:hypothetical protein
MSERQRVADFWDEVVNDFLQGGFPLPPPLDRWFLAYRGVGDGLVDQEAFPEPYGGPLLGDARFVILGLNPGVTVPRYQYRDGILAQEIRKAGRYSEVFKTAPVNREPWLTDIGPVGYLLSRVAFMRRWLMDESLGDQHMLTIELYPWHSRGVTAAIRPDPDIIESMVFAPIAETGVRHVFAFGAPWFDLLGRLGLRRLVTLGAGGEAYGSTVASRSVAVFQAAGYFVVAEKHAGSAGPPRPSETRVLKTALEERGLV